MLRRGPPSGRRGGIDDRRSPDDRVEGPQVGLDRPVPIGAVESLASSSRSGSGSHRIPLESSVRAEAGPHASRRRSRDAGGHRFLGGDPPVRDLDRSATRKYRFMLSADDLAWRSGPCRRSRSSWERLGWIPDGPDSGGKARAGDRGDHPRGRAGGSDRGPAFPGLRTGPRGGGGVRARRGQRSRPGRRAFPALRGSNRGHRRLQAGRGDEPPAVGVVSMPRSGGHVRSRATSCSRR